MSRTVRISVRLATAALGLWLAAMDAASAQDSVRKYQIDEQPLGQALREFALANNLDLLFSPDLVAGKKSPSLDGKFTVDEGLRTLLRGSGLEFSVSGSRVVISEAKETPARQAIAPTTSAPTGTNGYTRLAQAETNSSAQDVRSESRNSERDNSSRSSAEAEKNRIVLEEIVVVGTTIRGVYPSSSPVQIYTAEDIRRTGATTTEEFFRKLPQNLPTRTEIGAGSTTVPGNASAVNSIDLRGLGVGTTLVLMNGRRMGLTSNGQTVDISQIPMNAIARVEVLTDGASAIYGSDAIGGVVNFVTREDFEGAETRLGYGGTPSGGLRKTTAGQTFGHRWGSGNALISYNYYDAQPLEYADRSYTAPVGTGFLTPDETRHSTLATFSQDLSSRWAIDADFAWSERKVTAMSTRPAFFDTFESERSEYFGNLGVDFALNDSLDATILATYSSSDTSGARNTRSRTTGVVTPSRFDEKYHSWDLTAKLDGDLFALPAGDVRFSVGGGYTDERFENVLLGSTESGRAVTYAFAEVFAPLISPAQGISLAHRLELSLAARYTRYEDDSTPPSGIDFEGDPSPKIGLFWAPSPSFGLRATWGESFRAASLEQTSRARSFGSVILSDSQLGRPGIATSGGPGGLLTPETATSYTVGFDLTPEAVADLKVSGTYFNISYEDRIGRGVPNDVIAFANPGAFPELFNFTPTVAEIADVLRQITVTFNSTGIDLSDPAAAAIQLAALPGGFFIYDARNRNLARSELDGVDLSASYALDLDWGGLTFGGQFTKIFDYVQQNLSTSPVFAVVDTVLLPVDLRGRVYAGFTRGGFGGTLSVNYADDYINNLVVAAPRPIDSWTTVDVAVNYDFGDVDGLFEGVRLDLSIQNLFDQDPPFVATPGGSSVALQIPVGFDPVNANPIGRFVSISLTKNW